MATQYGSAVHNFGEEKWYSTADGVDPWSITSPDVHWNGSGGESASWTSPSSQGWSSPVTQIKTTKIAPAVRAPSNPISPPKVQAAPAYADEHSPPSANNMFFFQLPAGQRQQSWDQYVVTPEVLSANKATLPQSRYVIPDATTQAPSSPPSLAMPQQQQQPSSPGWQVSPTKGPVSPMKRSPSGSVVKQLQFSPTKSPESKGAPVAHDGGDGSESGHQSLYKTELCRSWAETGSCRYGTKCQFAHGVEELRPVVRHPKYKTEICRTFHTLGTCPYGTRCRFIHNRDGVLPPEWTNEMQRARSFSQPVITQQQQQQPVQVQQQQQVQQPLRQPQSYEYDTIGGEQNVGALTSQMKYLSMWDHPSGPAPVAPANVLPAAVTGPAALAAASVVAPPVNPVSSVLEKEQQQPQVEAEAAAVGRDARGADKRKGRLPFFERLTTSLRGGSSKTKDTPSALASTASASAAAAVPASAILKDKRSKSLAQ